VDHPAVTVVIPTRNRPELVRRAVESVFAQSFKDFEIVVVVDGRDPETVERLAGYSNRPLRVIVNDNPQGGAEARNIGSRAARGEWIAFLDDDDEWLPEKLDRQMAHLASAPRPENTVVSCRLIWRKKRRDTVIPRRLYKPGEPLAEYLFCWRSIGDKQFLQTSSLLANRELIARVPFTAGLKKHQDYDFLLRAASHAKADIVMLEEPLVIWHQDHAYGHVGGQRDWRFSLNWMRSSADLFTPAARTAFVLTVAVPPIWKIGLFADLFTRGEYSRPRLSWLQVWLMRSFIPARNAVRTLNRTMAALTWKAARA
jgi:glycosyltransferase involved in cell wall biosynthesis